jgi:hypothetical protein
VASLGISLSEQRIFSADQVVSSGILSGYLSSDSFEAIF